MTKGRLETFSDGVFAILITIMVLELGKPDTPTWEGLRHALPHILVYAMSFATLGIYWNNHHHMFLPVERINGGVLWANLHLLFWLSFVPYLTEWIGHQDRLEAVPVLAYGVVLLLASFGFAFLNLALIRANGRDSRFARALGKDYKGKVSAAIYTAAIALALVWPLGAMLLYVVTGAIWFIPDKRMEG